MVRLGMDSLSQGMEEDKVDQCQWVTEVDKVVKWALEVLQWEEWVEVLQWEEWVEWEE